MQKMRVSGFRVLLLVSCFFCKSKGAVVPALIMFGDSIVDVGNNNNLLSIVKSNFLPYGRDFIDQRPTGRFCNGKLAVDFSGKVFLTKPHISISPSSITFKYFFSLPNLIGFLICLLVSSRVPWFLFIPTCIPKPGSKQREYPDRCQLCISFFRIL